MAVFEYKAIGVNGKATSGIIDAESPAAARRKLRDQKLHPTNIAASFEKGESRSRSMSSARISKRDVAMLTRQLAVLLQAGMPLAESLGALLDQTDNAALKKVIYDIRAKVNEGKRLAEALGGHPRLFDGLYTSMVGAGEASGALEQVMFRLADLQERQVKLRHKIMSMLFYPILLSIFATGIVSFLMAVVVPRITKVFTRQHIELPMVTKVLMVGSAFLKSYWWAVIIAVLCLFTLWRAWVATSSGRSRWDSFKLKAPLYGKLYSKVISARYARILGTMLESGLTMMTALDVVKTVVQNKVVEKAMDDIKADVRRGRDLAVPLRESGLFPPMLIHMTELGQRSGELEAMLLKTADTYEDEVEVTVDALVSLLDPIIIIIMGSFVGFLVFAILLPIFEMTQGM